MKRERLKKVWAALSVLSVLDWMRERADVAVTVLVLLSGAVVTIVGGYMGWLNGMLRTSPVLLLALLLLRNRLVDLFLVVTLKQAKPEEAS